MTRLGVSKRNAERWITRDSTFHLRAVAELYRLAPLLAELDAELDAVGADFKADSIPET